MDTFSTPNNTHAELSPSGLAKLTQWTVWARLTGAPDVYGFTLHFYFIYPITIMGEDEIVLQPSILKSHRRQYSFPSMSVMFATFPTFTLSSGFSKMK